MRLRESYNNLKRKIRQFDLNSLRFKLWVYFILFAIILMAALWLFQTIFLQPYYQNMKKKEILRTAHNISLSYSQPKELDAGLLLNEIAALAIKNDMYIYLQPSDGSYVITSNSGADARQRFFLPGDRDIDIIRRQLNQSPSGTITLMPKGVSGKNDTMLYGTLIQSRHRSEAMLCIAAPLTPVESTIIILANQLVIVTVASLLLACGLSFWISRRLALPILQITKKARRLAAGEYGVTFDGGHYSEIQDLANTLTHTSAELAKADNLQRDLIANVSHDLRTPLTMVKSYAEMVRDLSGDNPEKRGAHLQVIIDEADRLNLLVSDLLLLSKMQSGVDSMQVQTFDLKETISGLMNMYSILEEQEGYAFRFIADEGPIMVTGDENRLKQVISNLVNNAVRYGGDQKEITVTLSYVYPGEETGKTTVTGGRQPQKALSAVTGGKQSHKVRTAAAVRVTVADKGPGIPADELEYIWDRYYKVSKTGTRSVSGGSGLGLSIVKEILLHHKAKFGVESQINQGSTFWFQLPL